MEQQTAQGERARAARGLACMEVWGGNWAFEGAVSAPGADVYVASTPHGGTARGGDIFYVSNCASGIITRIALADVAGHGESADALAGSLRRLMRKHINTADQRRFARDLNREFGALAACGRFATALLMTYFAPTDTMTFCNAGHPPALLYRARTGTWSAVGRDADVDEGAGETPRDLPLGVLSPTTYTQLSVRLEPGDKVVAYSDALVEARAANGRMLGTAGLLELLRRATPGDEVGFTARALREAAAVTGGAFDDDATLIVAHHHGAGVAREGLSGRIGALARRLGLARSAETGAAA